MNLAETHPAGASINQAIHYVQLHNCKKFRQYDWGPIGNVMKYGQYEPPDYDLSLVTASTYFYSGNDDVFCSPDDVNQLISHMPHLKNHHIVKDRFFTHFGFVLGLNVRELVNEQVIRKMNDYERNEIVI